MAVDAGLTDLFGEFDPAMVAAIQASKAEEDYYLAMESSANVNTNPRIEQTAVHASRDLFEFYKEFFDGIRSIDRSAPRATGTAGP